MGSLLLIKRLIIYTRSYVDKKFKNFFLHDVSN